MRNTSSNQVATASDTVGDVWPCFSEVMRLPIVVPDAVPGARDVRNAAWCPSASIDTRVTRGSGRGQPDRRSATARPRARLAPTAGPRPRPTASSPADDTVSGVRGLLIALVVIVAVLVG